jgi:TPR repeat protein
VSAPPRKRPHIDNKFDRPVSDMTPVKMCKEARKILKYHAADATLVKRALLLLNTAVEQGWSNAFCILGKMYQDGANGVPKDDTRAFQCFRQGAIGNSARCALNAGGCYYRGSGVPVNRDLGAEMYKLAARLGDTHAIERLKHKGIPFTPQHNQ